MSCRFGAIWSPFWGFSCQVLGLRLGDLVDAGSDAFAHLCKSRVTQICHLYLCTFCAGVEAAYQCVKQVSEHDAHIRRYRRLLDGAQEFTRMPPTSHCTALPFPPCMAPTRLKALSPTYTRAVS